MFHRAPFRTERTWQMRGPKDIELPKLAGTTEAAAAPRVKERPAGGKALLRLLDLLVKKGYTNLAAEAVEAALPGEVKESLLKAFEISPKAKKPPAGRRGA